MNKEDRINEILFYWRNIAKENPVYDFNSTLSSDRIYHDLISRGVPKQDRLVDISADDSTKYPYYFVNSEYESPYANPSSPFNNWIKYYAHSNTEVSIPNNRRYFCQFVSKDEQAKQARENLKVYIPLDSEHIENGARLIFNFLEDNHISHESEISKRIRLDDIVIKLIRPDDVDRLIEFVNNNSYLHEGLLPANPFAFNRNGIALSIDGKLSYTNTIADMIDLYIDHKKESEELDSVDATDFFTYVERLYYAYYISPNSNTESYNTFNGFIARKIKEHYDEHHRTLSNDEIANLIENYRQIIGLIVKSSKPNFTYSDYLRHYSDNSKAVYLSDKVILETNRLLIEAFEALTERFGNPDGYRNVRAFFNIGLEDYITRENNLRARMINSPFRENLRLILQVNKVDFDTYAKMVLNQYHIDLAEIDRMRKSK